MGNEHENNGDGTRLLELGRGSGGAARKNEVRLKRDEFLRESFHQLDISRRPANVDLAVAALQPPELPKPFPKRRDRGLPFLVALGGERQDTDPAHPFGLLRVGRNRPRHGPTAEQGVQLAQPRSITSSVRASIALSGDFGLARRAAIILTFLYLASAVTSAPIHSGRIKFWFASVSSTSASTTPSKSPS